MASLTVTQPTGEGISLKFVYGAAAAETAVSGTVYLATTSIDNQEFISKDFVYTGNQATVILTTAELVRVYTQGNVNSGTYTATVTMSATALNSLGATVTQTTITGLATAATLTYQAVPTTPTVTTISAQDGYIQFIFTTVSAVALTLSAGNAVCDVIVNSANDGIETFSGLASSAYSSDGTTRTVTVQTGAASLTNGQSYEAAVRTSNANGNSLFSDTQTIVPNNLPNALAGVAVNTAYSSGTTLDGTNAAVMTATWTDADANTGGTVLVRFGVVDGNGDFNANPAIQQATVTLTAANYTGAATAVGSLNILNAWYGASQSGVAINSGSAVTEIDVVARIEQTTSGVTTSSALTTAVPVFKITLPTISAIDIISVNAAGLQTFNLSSGGTAVDSATSQNGNTAATLVAAYNGVNYAIATTISNNSSLAQDAAWGQLTYTLVDAGSNGNLTYTLSLPDANGTQSGGSLVSYGVTRTQALHAFKDPEAPDVTLVGGAVTVPPTLTVTDAQENFGYTVASYTANVYDNAVNSYKTYTNATYNGTATVATANTGSAYVVAQYLATVTKNLSGIPSPAYDGTYTSPTITGTAGAIALYFVNPTITSVSINNAVMTIAGNTGGSLFDAAGVTSIGFVAQAGSFNLSTKTANMQAGITPTNAAACAYSVAVTHDSNLQLNVNSNGGAFDGFGFVNSNNANSALSILN